MKEFYEAENAIVALLVQIKDPSKRARAKEYLSGGLTIASRALRITDGYALDEVTRRPVCVDLARALPATAFAVNPREGDHG